MLGTRGWMHSFGSMAPIMIIQNPDRQCRESEQISSSVALAILDPKVRLGIQNSNSSGPIDSE